MMYAQIYIYGIIFTIYNYNGFEEKENGTDNRFDAIVSVQDTNAHCRGFCVLQHSPQYYKG